MINKYLYAERRLRIPEYVYFILTERCPLKCPQCYNVGKEPKEMLFEIFVDNFDQAREMGVKKIALIGGEILFYSDIEKVLGYVSESDIYCTFASSGYNIEKIIHILKQSNNIYPIISLNASKKEIDKITRDGFEYSIKAMQLLEENNIAYSINWVAHHSNVNDFSDFLDFVFGRGAENVLILQTKRNTEDIVIDNLTEKDVQKLSEIVTQSSFKNRIMVDRCSAYLQERLFGRKEKRTVGKGCCAGEFIMAVNVDGKYQPCQHMSIISNELKLNEAWTTSEKFALVRDSRQGCIAEIK